MERASHRGCTQNGCWLASGRLSALLEMALQSSTDGWPKVREQRDPGSNLSHGGRKSNLRSPTHPRGAIKAGLQSIGEHRFPMGSASSEKSRFGQAFADVPAEPSRGHCGDGLLHGTNLWCTVLLLVIGLRVQSVSPWQNGGCRALGGKLPPRFCWIM